MGSSCLPKYEYLHMVYRVRVLLAPDELEEAEHVVEHALSLFKFIRRK